MNHKCRHGEAASDHGQEGTRGPLQIGLMYEGLKLRPDFEFAQPIVDPGDGAELLILAQINDLIARLPAFRGQCGVQRGLNLFGLLRGP